MKKKQLKQIVNTKEITEKDALQYLKDKGYSIEKFSPEQTGRKYKFDKSKFKGDTFKIAVISCTQLGSKYQQLTHLRDFYSLIADEGIDTVLHCGDFVDGEKMYRGHEYEIFKHGADAQREYAIEAYPKVDGVKTYIISGNHDFCYFKRSGYDIMKDIASERSDMEYLGAFSADLDIKNVKIKMMHGDSGNTYARSYRMQKIIEQAAPEAKPDVLVLGHYHTNVLLPEYRNVTGLQLGCFQAQTPYLVRKGLYPEVSGWIVEFKVNNKGRRGNKVGINFRFVPFYKMKKKDY